MADEAAEFRESLLSYPGERPNVDYKAAKPFDTNQDEFTLKLVKHIIGMANDGGGHIVIGYKEGSDKRPAPDENMSATICGTYDVTKLSQFVNAHVKKPGKVSVEIYPTTKDRIFYPVIRVHGFSEAPIFCSSTKGDILKDGALYIRSNDTNTVGVARPEDWERLIAVVIEKRNDELLRRFRSLAEQLGLVPDFTTANSRAIAEEFQRNTLEFACDFLEEAEKRGFPKGIFFVHHALQSGTYTWPKTELLKAAEAAERPNTGWPLGLVLRYGSYREDGPKVTTSGISATIEARNLNHLDYWNLTQSGAFFTARVLQEDLITSVETTKYLWADTQIWRVAEAVEHCIALYRALGVDPTSRVMLAVGYRGMENRVLSTSPQKSTLLVTRHYQSSQDQLEWNNVLTLDVMASDVADLVHRIAHELYENFGFFDLRPDFTQQVFAEYNGSRVR